MKKNEKKNSRKIAIFQKNEKLQFSSFFIFFHFFIIFLSFFSFFYHFFIIVFHFFIIFASSGGIDAKWLKMMKNVKKKQTNENKIKWKKIGKKMKKTQGKL